MQKKNRTVRILRIIGLSVAIIGVVIFPPWDGIWAWLAPLPNTVQEQVDAAFDHGLDGIIVYVDQSDKAPALYAAGWKNRAAFSTKPWGIAAINISIRKSWLRLV